MSHRPSGPTTQSSATQPLAARPWPASARIDVDGLEIGGISADELARTFGTPVMVIDEDEVRDRAREFRDAFGTALYAVKGPSRRDA